LFSQIFRTLVTQDFKACHPDITNFSCVSQMLATRSCIYTVETY